MHKLIKELAEQAWDDTREKFGSFVDDGGEIDYAFLHAYDQKFAELIVQECAEVCYDHSNAAGGVDTHFGYGYKDCGDDIKRNFGVKE